jgi:ABC-type lipoprotein export system ATPase subunit
MALFAKLHAGGNTLVVVTHEADVAALAARSIHLRDGQVEKDLSESEFRMQNAKLKMQNANSERTDATR